MIEPQTTAKPDLDSTADLAALDSARIDTWLDGLRTRPALSDNDLRHLLTCLERGAWRDDQLICPVRWVKFSPYQRSLLLVRIAAEIESRGGSFAVGGEVWRAEGERVWKTLPWGETR